MPVREKQNPIAADECLKELLALLFSDIPDEACEEEPEETDWEDEEDEEELVFRVIPEVRKVYFNDRHTTIEWADGEKTTVGCAEGQMFDEYSGFGAAVLKRLFGSSTAAIRYMDELKEVQPVQGKKEKSPTDKKGVNGRA